MPALSGVLFSLAFPPVDAGYIAWFALIPLLLALRHRSPREAFGLGYLAGFVAFVLILSWMRLFGVVPWLLLAGYLAVYVGVFAALLRWLTGDRSARWTVLLAPLVWTGLEYLRSIGPLGFPWALLGVSQHADIPVLQLARLTGVYGISALLVAVNALLAASIMRPRTLMPWVVILGLVLVFIARSSIVRLPAAETGTVRVATLQPNVPPPLKFDPAAARNNLDVLRSLVDQAAAAPTDLVVMPETALPADIFGSSGLLPVVAGWARAARATLMATSLENGTSNIAVAVAPSGTAVARYDKVRLVAFAESGITPGFRHSPMWTPLGSIGVSICFESIFPEVSRDLVRAGAEMLLVTTNDAWSDGTAGPAQHARFAVIRAVEMGRWLVQASNSGVSQIIDPAGRVAASLPIGQPGALRGRVSLRHEVTPYVRWGDWVAQLMLAGIVLAAALLRREDLLAEFRSVAFRSAAAVSVLPLAAVAALLSIGAPWWAWTVALFALVAAFAAGRIRPLTSDRPIRWGLPAAAVAGSAVVAVLWGVVVIAYRANQVPLEVVVPTQVAVMLRQLLIAAALELWLRGQVFTSIARWKGVPVAIGVTTLMGMAVQAGLSAEAVAWAMVTGLAFGIIRARTGSALGLVVPHALGHLLIGFLTVVR